MCSNPEKARYMKIFIEEIRAEIAKWQARKAAAAASEPTQARPDRPAEPALAG